MTELPIHQLRDRVVTTAVAQKRLIITAPTGSGKSTQVPQMLLDGGLLGNRQVVVLQPRRLAARLLAAWVAQDRHGRLGDEVGYQIRFDDVTSAATRIRYVTEGILLRQMLTEPGLRGVGAILFDEFHERHLYGDITLARALDLQESSRPDLILGVMSATLDTGPLEQYLRPCATLSSPGRTYPVAIEYLTKPIQSPRSDGGFVAEEPVWEVAVRELRRLVAAQPEGDALIFMPGAYEIARTAQAARDALGNRFVVLPLHGELPPADQDAAVARYPQRKIVVATNVAETSITIDGIRLVIDSGLARIPRFDPYRGINTLLVEKISRAAADQRAGRAGRTAPGHCLRLWTEREHESRPAQELPEVKRLDLSEVVLTLKASGVPDVKAFRWFEPPDPKSLDRAEILLLDLGALQASSPSVQQSGASILLACHDGSGKLEARPTLPARAGTGPLHITDLGRRMLAFPLHPRYSRMLLAAQTQGCVRPVALIAALTQGRNLLVRSEGPAATTARAELFGDEGESDLFVWMRAWRYADRNGYNVDRCRRLGIHAQTARQVGPVLDQFLKIAQQEGLDLDSTPRPSTPVAPPPEGAAPSAPREQTPGTKATAEPGSTHPPSFNERIQKCVLAGFSDQVARRIDQGTLRCDLVHGRRGVLARESVVQTPLLVAADVREVQSGTGKDKELKVLLNLATAVRVEWLRELFPADFQEAREIVYDPALRRVFVERRQQFRDLVLESERGDNPPLDEAARILAREIAAGHCVLKHWDAAVEQWIVRVNRLREWMPELALPEIRDEDRLALLEQVCHGATGYKDIKDRPVWPAVKSWLSPQQQDWVEQYTPERLELPGGRKVKVNYSATAPPAVAARIQDLYGVREGLWIGRRTVPVVIEVLAPNQRPVQVTQNLAVFWKETYPKIKQELQRKYPKHEWR